jgi:hypothetical protein
MLYTRCSMPYTYLSKPPYRRLNIDEVEAILKPLWRQFCGRLPKGA